MEKAKGILRSLLRSSSVTCIFSVVSFKSSTDVFLGFLSKAKGKNNMIANEYGKSTIILPSIFLSAITSDVPIALGGYVDSLCEIDVSTELAGSSDITCLVSIY